MSTEKHNLATCPRCAYPVVAELDLHVEPGKPFFAPDSRRWVANASVTIAAVRVNHQCSADDPTPFDDMLGAVMGLSKEAGE